MKIFAFLVQIDIARPIHPPGWSVLFVNNGFTRTVFKTLVFNNELTILYFSYSVFCIIFSRLLHLHFPMTTIVRKKVFTINRVFFAEISNFYVGRTYD